MTALVKSFVRALLPRTIRSRVILAGPLRGYRIVTSWHDYPAAITGRTERPLIDWFEKNVHPEETWLDVGAHYGYTAVALSRLVGASGRVFAFEPMISTAGYVTQTRQLNEFPQLIVLPLGLASPEALEMVQLPVTRGMVDSTLAEGEDRRAGPERGNGMKDEGRTTLQDTIMVARLDWLWPRVCGKREQIDGIKIDVQGMEIQALRGMTAQLDRYRPKLVIEFHPQVDRGEMLKILEASGYAAHGVPVEPQPRDQEGLYLDDKSYAFMPI